MISSRSVDELRALLAPVIGQHGLRRGSAARRERSSISSACCPGGWRSSWRPPRRRSGPRCSASRSPGSTWTTRARSTTRSCVPLDDHLELYRDARRAAQELGEAVSLQAHGPGAVVPGRAAPDDHLPARRGEVLQRSARECPASSQLQDADRRRSWRAARRCSASGSTRPLEMADRPDRAVRNAELAGMLRFYLGPGGTAPDDARRCRRRGRVAARQSGQAGVPAPVHQDRSHLRPVRHGGRARPSEGGVEYHRIGRDLIEELLDAMPTDPAPGRRGRSARALSSLDVSLPRLADAAFRAPDAVVTRRRRSPSSAAIDPSLTIYGDEPWPDPTSRMRLPKPRPWRSLTLEPVTPEGETVAPERAPEADFSVEPRRVQMPDSRKRSRGTAAPRFFLGTAQPSPQYGVLEARTAIRPDGRARPERDAYDQPVRRAGRRQELHARIDHRGRHVARTAGQPAAEAAGHDRLPLQPDARLRARVHQHGRAEPGPVAGRATSRSRYGGTPAALE